MTSHRYAQEGGTSGFCSQCAFQKTGRSLSGNMCLRHNTVLVKPASLSPMTHGYMFDQVVLIIFARALGMSSAALTITQAAGVA